MDFRFEMFNAFGVECALVTGSTTLQSQTFWSTHLEQRYPEQPPAEYSSG